MTTDAEMLGGDQGVTIALQGHDYHMPLPTRRRARTLMAGVVRMSPVIDAMGSALRDAGYKAGKTLTDAQAKALPAEASAAMLELYDPLCEWLQLCVPDIPDTVLDEANEVELVKAFASIKVMLLAPLAQSGSEQQKSEPKKTSATPQRNTSAANKQTKSGNHESTK